MTKKIKLLPADRAQWSFGGLVYWHFFIQGTRPEGAPGDVIGRLWKPKDAMAALGIGARGFWNWIDDDHFPYDTVALERELFGNSPLFDNERLELQEKLRTTRAAKAEEARAAKASEANNTASPFPPVPEDSAEPSQPEAETEQTESEAARGYDIVEWRPAGPRFGGAGNGSRSATNGAAIVPAEPVQARWSPKSKPPPRRVAAFVVPGVALLVGVFAWASMPSKPTKSGKSDTPTAVVGPGPDGTEKPPVPPVNPPPPNPPPGPVTDPDKDARQRDASRAEERRKAEEARKDAERQRQLDATKAALDQKKREDEANAKAMNAKLKALAQADGNDLCKMKLEGLSVPGFTLKCDTLIPFGDLLGSVPVSQTASSLADCAARCRKAVSPKCVAFSFDAGAHTGSASCYLTGSIPAYNNATNWIAGER